MALTTSYPSLLNAPEYATLIDALTKRFAQQKAEAEASGIGEAQRRGLINSTGTSDIEGMIRQSKLQPVVNAESSAIGDVLGQAAQIGNQNQQNQLQRDWQTGERTGTQGWQTGENLADRTWRGTQNQADYAHQTALLDKQRAWNLQDQPSGWQSFLQGVTPGLGKLGTNLIGTGIKKLLKW